MPPRPELKTKGNRPNSAIYLGNSPNIGGPVNLKQAPSSSSPYETSVQSPPALPDLPAPPSPESSPESRGSGLPSPPATNSTGSGSTGDPGSIALRQRQRPLSLASDSSGSSHRTLSERSVIRSRSSSRSSHLRDEPLPPQADDDDYNDDDDNDDLDGDRTARLDRRHRSNDHSLVLQRVKSLTQRNKLAIDKLARLGSPSPSVVSSSNSSSRLRQARTTLSQDQGASGSETERESTSASSSSRRPITPPSNNSHHVTLAGASSPYSRLRRISAPDSPQKVRLTAGSSPSGNSPTARRRKRASMASMAAIQAYPDEDEDEDESRFSTATGGKDRSRGDTVRDITQSALAAVASARSPLGTRRRGALPKEFVEGTAELAETKSVTSRRSDDIRDRNRPSIEPVTPYKGVARSSTLREVGRTALGPSRWTEMAEPLSEGKRERRATLRGGSAESALKSPGRTLLGEGLRAAGLTPRRDDIRTPGPSAGDGFRDRAERSPQENRDRARLFTPAREPAMRAATSMADYRSLDREREDEEDGEHRPSTSALKSHRSTYSTYSVTKARELRRTRDLSLTRTERDQLELDRSVLDSAVTAQASGVPKHLYDRHSTVSPYGSKRLSQATTSTDHVRLMLETLQSFEGNISKLASGLAPTIGKMPSAAELMKHAQNVVYTTERINALMRQGTSKALEEQINAEVNGDEAGGTEQLLEVWRGVGGEYREGLRASDELVRALTGFLMDVGSTLRKLSPSCEGSEYSSPATHARSISLDEEGIRQQALSAASSDLSGRRSVDVESISRRSLDREEALRKLGGGTGRESSLSHARPSPALAALRDRERNIYNTPSPASTYNKPLPPLSAGIPSNPARRLFTPSQQRDRQLETQLESNRQAAAMRPSDSQKTIQPVDVDLSPTPASKVKERTRTMPPSRPLPTATDQARRTPISKAVSNGTSSSSASTSVERNSSVRERTHERRKPSVASIITVRGSQPPPFSNLTTPSTAITSVTPHTVSNSPEEARVPSLMRTGSTMSTRASITFSRPSTSSVSAALSGIQQQAIVDDRKRSNSTSDGNEPRAPARKSVHRTLANARSEPEAGQDDARVPRTASIQGYNFVADETPATPFSKASTSHPADRHAASTIIPRTNFTTRDRRSVSEVFPRE